MANEVVYNLGVVKYTYNDCKEHEINLGLDLKGGMNVTLEVAVEDIVIAMAGANNELPEFKVAIEKAHEMQANSQEGFIDLFYDAWLQDNEPNLLSMVFGTIEMKDVIPAGADDETVLLELRRQADAAFGNTKDVLSKRIDRFGVAQPRIQPLAARGRILVELPGVKDPVRVRKILQATAKLEFWETYKFNEQGVFDAFIAADQITAEYYSIEDKAKADEKETPKMEETATEPEQAQDAGEPTLDETAEAVEDAVEGLDAEMTLDVEGDDNGLEVQTDDADALDVVDPVTDEVEQEGQKRLFAYLAPNVYEGRYPGNGPVVGRAYVRDTTIIGKMLRLQQVQNVLPRDMKLLWGKTNGAENDDVLSLYAIKVPSDQLPPLDGDAIADARQDIGQTGTVEVTMKMNSQGALDWKNLTAANIQREVAIVLDDYVYSAPTVQSEISGGRSQITGSFDVQEAQDLANVLKSGKLPVPARIIEEAIVGPSLGHEAVNAGLISFIAAFLLVLIYMGFYYSRAGIVANIALIANMFFLFGVLASIQAVLTLPGIAGIILTLGMAVDANVIIFERIKEEIRAGKGPRLALSDGYKNAYSAIIDGNVTTLLTGIVLYVFGSGPVQGFATTLIIGIITSLFSAIFISRLIFTWMLGREKTIKFGNKMTLNAMVNAKYNFIGARKIAFMISGAILVIGLGFLATKGLNPGVDFAGGRTYVIRFDQDVNTQDISKKMSTYFVDENGMELTPEVKTFGPTSQIKLTTKYMIDNKDKSTDSIVDNIVFSGVKEFYKDEISAEEFFSSDEDKARGKLSSQKVDPTISDDLIWQAYLSLFFALIVIFAYIALRFRKWQFGLGGLAALIHDALLVVSLYSIFYGILPFDMEVDQAFIAAILTIIGYSINDSVIIFDRIREFTGLYKKQPLVENMNNALNSTLARTINTSGTTIIVLLIIFIFGGEVIRGFTFALLVGVMVGTYSSLFVASPVAYEMLKRKEDKAPATTKKKK
jgi:SecD/SecF fusion protein